MALPLSIACACVLTENGENVFNIFNIKYEKYEWLNIFKKSISVYVIENCGSCVYDRKNLDHD